MMESYWLAIARGDEEAPPAMREWAVTLEAKPKYVVSSTRKDFPWINSHHLAGDLRTSVPREAWGRCERRWSASGDEQLYDQTLGVRTVVGIRAGESILSTDLERPGPTPAAHP